MKENALDHGSEASTWYSLVSAPSQQSGSGPTCGITPQRMTSLMWWEEQPDGNIGLLTGNGLVVVDCDSPEAVAIVEAVYLRHLGGSKRTRLPLLLPRQLPLLED